MWSCWCITKGELESLISCLLMCLKCVLLSFSPFYGGQMYVEILFISYCKCYLCMTNIIARNFIKWYEEKIIKYILPSFLDSRWLRLKTLKYKKMTLITCRMLIYISVTLHFENGYTVSLCKWVWVNSNQMGWNFKPPVNLLHF